jgi:hypothetical protein
MGVPKGSWILFKHHRFHGDYSIQTNQYPVVFVITPLISRPALMLSLFPVPAVLSHPALPDT